MKEIRWHGRGGNGGFTSARMLGYAALRMGKYAQAFPSFGPERRGAPVLGFTRISDTPITDHSQVYSCDCVIVLDETLVTVANVLDGLKEDGSIFINSEMSAEEFKKAYKGFENVKNLYTIDATKLALEELGTNIVNTVMMGAAVGGTDLVTMDALDEAVDGMMKGTLAEKNKKVIKMAYNAVKGGMAK